VMRRICLIAAVTLTAGTSTTVQAQDSVAEGVGPSVWQHAAKNYWHVRLIVAEGDTLAGRVQYLRRGATIGGAPVPDAYLHLDRRLSHGRGMYVGAGIGALIGAVIIGGYAAALSEAGDNTHMAALAGAAGGATLGMVVGHLAAPAQHRWIRIWP
jgi:hypothetical protein